MQRLAGVFLEVHADDTDAGAVVERHGSTGCQRPVGTCEIWYPLGRSG